MRQLVESLRDSWKPGGRSRARRACHLPGPIRQLPHSLGLMFSSSGHRHRHRNHLGHRKRSRARQLHRQPGVHAPGAMAQAMVACDTWSSELVQPARRGALKKFSVAPRGLAWVGARRFMGQAWVHGPSWACPRARRGLPAQGRASWARLPAPAPRYGLRGTRAVLGCPARPLHHATARVACAWGIPAPAATPRAWPAQAPGWGWGGVGGTAKEPRGWAQPAPTAYISWGRLLCEAIPSPGCLCGRPGHG